MIKNKYDICIIGAGIVGLAHAYHAAKRGLSVVIFERNQFALGASVRNFGLVWPIGQKNEMFERAMHGRTDWIELAEKGVLQARPNGSLHLAYHEDEMQVLNEFQEMYGSAYETSLLDHNTIKKEYSYINQENLKGGLLSATELTIDPREAISVLPEYLKEKYNVKLLFGKTVVNLDGQKVATWDEEILAEKTIICSGADFETLYPSVYRTSGIKKCKLQMMRSQPLSDFKLGPTLCAGLTLRHYDAFSECPSLAELDKRYDSEMPDMKKHGIHVLIAQNALGELIIGDSHAYEQDFYPFDQEAINELILDYLATFFKVKGLKIQERWHGIYPKLEGATEWMHSPAQDVHIVNGLSGAGMTLSFGLAKENMKRWIG